MSEHVQPLLPDTWDSLVAAQLDFAYNNPDAEDEELWLNQVLMNEAQIHDPRLYDRQLHFPDESRDEVDISNEIEQAWTEEISEEDDDDEEFEDDQKNKTSLSDSSEATASNKRIKFHHKDDDATEAHPPSDWKFLERASSQITLVDRTRNMPTTSTQSSYASNSFNDRYTRAGIPAYDTAVYRNRASYSSKPKHSSLTEGLRKLQPHSKQQVLRSPTSKAKANSEPASEESDDDFEMIKKPSGSSTNSTLTSPVSTRRSSEVEVVQAVSEAPLLLRKLEGPCLSALVDLLYFPDAFALSMTCKAMNQNTNINLKRKKAEYSVCLYMLPFEAYFHPKNCKCCVLKDESQGSKGRKDMKICIDCLDFRKRINMAKGGQFDAQQAEDDWVVVDKSRKLPSPIWRPHRKRPSRAGALLWFRDRY